MRYYVKLVKWDGTIAQDYNIFGTLEEAKVCERIYQAKLGYKATIYKIELVPVEEEV